LRKAERSVENQAERQPNSAVRFARVSEWGVAPGPGLAGYAAVLRDPPVRRLLAASQVARLGTAMLPLSLVVFGSTVTGSPAGGAALLASFSLTTAFAPARARVVDRGGAPALAAFVTAYAALLAGVAGLGAVDAAPAPLVVAGALAGAVAAPLGPYARAVMGAALQSRPDLLQRAYALDSAGEEASLIVGPLIVALFTAAWTPAAALLAAAALVLAGGLGTARSSVGGRPVTAARTSSGASPRVPARAWLVVVALAATGVALGAVDVAVPAITRASGVPATAGVLLAAMAAGTALGSLGAGMRAWRWPPLRRLAAVQLPLAVAFAACALLDPLGALAIGLIVPGVLLGILFVSAYLAIGELAPAGTATRVFSWLLTANNGGLALGAAVAGAVANAHPRAGLWLAAAAVLPAAALAFAAARRGTSRTRVGRSIMGGRSDKPL
jgi:hypothetical protein